MMPTLSQAVAALAGEATPALLMPGEARDSVAPETVGTQAWSQEALDMLEEADTRLREGDFQGFGEALEELRVLLERLARESGQD